MASRVKPVMGCGYAFAACILAAGVAVIALGTNTLARGIGAAVVVLAFVYVGFARRTVKQFALEEARREALAHEPWKLRKAWLQPVIADDGDDRLFPLLAMAILWNAVSIPAAIDVATHFSKQKPGAALVFVFPAIGAVMLGFALHRLIRRRKFGVSHFTPTEMPGVIGGHFGGVITVRRRVIPDGAASVSLRCFRRVTTGAGKTRRVTETTLWEAPPKTGSGDWTTSAKATHIPVLFYVPRDKEPSDHSRPENEVVWQLMAKAEVPGINFTTTFTVPVYVTEKSEPKPA